MQEIQSAQHRYEGRMEENERRVAHVIGPKYEKLYVVEESTCYKNIKYVSKQEEEKHSLLNSQMHSEL